MAKGVAWLRVAMPAAAGAAVLGWLFFTGIVIHQSPSRDILIAAIWRHVGYGVVLAPLAAGYLVWRFASLRRGPVSSEPLLDRAGAVAFYVAAAVVLFLLVSGPIVVWTYGVPLKVFDWFVLANPFGERELLHDRLEEAHVWLARAAPWLIAADLVLFALLERNRRGKRR